MARGRSRSFTLVGTALRPMFQSSGGGGGPSAPVITSSLTASGTVGVAFSYTITATNSPTSYNATGLPAGLSINTGTGAITGTPSAAATTNITISATNAGGTGSATLVLTVAAAGGATLSGASAVYSDIFAWLRVTTDTGSGTLYAVVVPAAASPPTGAQIEAGQDGSGAAATASANQAISASGAKDLLIRSFTAATAYKIYGTHKVGANYSNIVNVAFTSDTLVVAAATDGTTTSITVSAGSTFTNTQSDPFGGTNAVKWADNGDASSTAVSLNVGATFFNGVNKFAFLVKYQSGSAWQRVSTINLTAAIVGNTHWNTSTGAAGTNATPWTNVVILSLGSGWYMFTGRIDMTGAADLIGALQMFKAATDNSAALGGTHDGTHIQFLHNIRITR